MSVLGALDDKIDSNRRLAGSWRTWPRRCFVAWFVDFVGEEFEPTGVIMCRRSRRGRSVSRRSI